MAHEFEGEFGRQEVQYSAFLRHGANVAKGVYVIATVVKIPRRTGGGKAKQSSLRFASNHVSDRRCGLASFQSRAGIFVGLWWWYGSQFGVMRWRKHYVSTSEASKYRRFYRNDPFATVAQ